MKYSSLNLEVIPFVLFPQASEPSMNFNISEMGYWMDRGFEELCSLRDLTGGSDGAL